MVGLAVVTTPTGTVHLILRKKKEAHAYESKVLLLRLSMDVRIAESLTSRYSDFIFEALDDLEDNFLITDPFLSGHPIVFASNGFLRMSGYERQEVVGKNGRMFQGPRTDWRSIFEIREAIREERSTQVNLLNYMKDGKPIWIFFYLFPVFAKDDGQVTNFVAVQVPIERSRGRKTMSGKSEGRHSCGGEGIVFGSCRSEICADTETKCSFQVDSFIDSDKRVLEAEQLCEASDFEKQKAVGTANNILSILTRYSELTGKLVSGRQCSSCVTPFNSSLLISLGRIKQSFVLTDPTLPDMPIVYASDAFLSLTGYSRPEVLGRNCRFLNGPATDVGTSYKIKENIDADRGCSVRILNYRKDGTSFWNLLLIEPVRNATGKIAFFVEVQMDESENKDGQILSPEMRQLGAIGAVKVAVRRSSMTAEHVEVGLPQTSPQIRGIWSAATSLHSRCLPKYLNL